MISDTILDDIAYDLGLVDTPHPVSSAKLSIRCQVRSWMGDRPISKSDVVG